MSLEQELALKGEGVEEWLDVRFFRPVGIRIARALLPTKITPDQVTIASLVLGLVAAHLFYYEGWAVNAAAFGLTVVADLLDSSDGQLARLRGTTSRTGRLMDGCADNVRWIAVHTHVAFRAMAQGHGLWVVPVAFAAGYAHSVHSATVDLVSHAYLELAGGRREIDLPEDIGAPPPGWFWAFTWPFYTGFARLQERLFKRTIGAVRRARRGPLPAEARERYGRATRRVVVGSAWIGQNAHIIVLGTVGVLGAPVAFFAVVGVGMSAVAAWLIAQQERAAGLLPGSTDDSAAAG